MTKEQPASTKKYSAQRQASKLSKSLVFAAFEGDEKLVAELLSLGAHANAQHKISDSWGEPLMPPR